jgi:hypothetical protein
MKRLGGRVHAEADERERTGVGERERDERARAQHGREVVAAHPAQRRVAKAGEDARVERDHEHERGADPRHERGELRDLGEQQRRHQQRAEQREGRLVRHAGQAHARGHAGPRRARHAHRGHQQPGGQIAAQRGQAPHAEARKQRDLASDPVQDHPPQGGVDELGERQTHYGQQRPTGGEPQIGIGELVGLREHRQHDTHRDERGERGEQCPANAGADPRQGGVGEARRHGCPGHAASL